MKSATVNAATHLLKYVLCCSSCLLATTISKQERAGEALQSLTACCE